MEKGVPGKECAKRMKMEEGVEDERVAAGKIKC